MTDPRLVRLDRLTAAMGREIESADPAAPTGWPELPDVAALVRHVGAVQRWVVAVLAQRRPVAEGAIPADPGVDLRTWFEEGRLALRTALEAVAPDEPCWVIGPARPVAGFWRRRMVVEHAKHLIDLRAAASRSPWSAAAELEPTDYADAIDELFEVMLPRTRATLPPLPGPVVLEATDTGEVWRVGGDWSVDRRAGGDEAARIAAGAADLALALWERADPVGEPGRFRITGDARAVAALRSAQIHPW